jgi:thioredoxin reductase
MDGYEVAIVGGGPAGLSAALVLGRCCRRVLLCDGGRPRNARSRAVRGFLTRDGVTPASLRRIGRHQLARYSSVELREIPVASARAIADGFELALADGTLARARKLLLATGIADELPPIPGLAELWGRGVFPCPYCDAFEHRAGALGALGRGPRALELCRALTGWSRRVTLFSDGDTGLDPEQERGLLQNQIRIVRAPIQRVRGGRRLEAVQTEGGSVPCDALFVAAPQRQRASLVAALGCETSDQGCVETGEHESTNVPGLYVAGDASSNVQFAIVAAAEGAEAAFAIHRSLVRERFERRACGP